MAAARAHRVLICVRRHLDPYGTHDVSSRAFAAAYQALGFAPAFVNLSAPVNLPRLLEVFGAGEFAFAHCEQGHGLSLSARIGGRDLGLFDHFNVPAIAHVRDYPFAPWLRPYLLKANQNVFVFHTDACAPDMLRPLGITRGTHRFAPHVALEAPEPHAGERDIPLLYIGSISAATRLPRLFAAVFSRNGRTSTGPSTDWSISAPTNSTRPFTGCCSSGCCRRAAPRR
jgi:hypothetical protein